MRLLLTMNVPYFPTRGGADRGHRRLLEGLAARGHQVEVVVPALATPPRLSRAELHAQLALKGVAVADADTAETADTADAADAADTADAADRFTLDGVAVHAVPDAARLCPCLTERIHRAAPDWVLVASEDPSQKLLAAALQAAPGRVVYCVNTPAFLPFGPHSFFPSRERSELISRVTAIIAMSRFLADYIRSHGGHEAAMIHWPAYGEPPFPCFTDGERGFVTLVNPCTIKGLPILLELAGALPGVQFAAVPTWGTTTADRAALTALANVTLLEPQEDFDRILARTRVVLMPSLIAEGFGHTAVEAMLRGIPVLASDAGGLPEAKLGVDYVIPVLPIERFGSALDENLIPIPVVPRQDAGPWRDTLSRLLGDRELYGRLAAASRAAALAFVAGLGVGPFESLLARLGEARGGASTAAAVPRQPAAAGAGLVEGVRSLTPEQRALLLLRLQRRRRAAAPDGAGPPALEPASRAGPLPLSFAQQRLWFVEQLRPGTPAYNVAGGIVLEGPLATAALAAGLLRVVGRHESLRTVFAARGGIPQQRILPPPAGILRQIDLTALPPARRQAEADALAARQARRAFDLERGPLLRALLLRLAPERHVLLLVLHHIVADGWSLRLVLGELAALYGAASRGGRAELPELPVQYADFAVWQRRRLAGDGLAAQIAYWRRQLAGSDPRVVLPTRRLFPAASGEGALVPLAAPLALLEALRALCHGARATLFMALLTGWQVLLHRYSGQDDVVVGTHVANRHHQRTEGVVGFFVNNLALRADLSGRPSFAAALARVRRMVLEAQANQEAPFEKLVGELAPPGERDGMPLFRILIAHADPAAAALPAMPGLTLRPFAVATGAVKFDLALLLEETATGLGGGLEYDRGLFDAQTAREMVADYLELLADAARRPEAPIDLLTLAAGGDAPPDGEVGIRWSGGRG
jgi:glycosyltransferase involved in cell wall biosynthesis